MTTKVSPGTTVRNFGLDFGKKAFEGATLSGLAMVAIKALSNNFSSSFPAVSANHVVAGTITGALAWPLFKTVYTPLCTATYNNLSGVAKGVTNYATSFFSSKPATKKRLFLRHAFLGPSHAYCDRSSFHSV